MFVKAAHAGEALVLMEQLGVRRMGLPSFLASHVHPLVRERLPVAPTLLVAQHQQLSTQLAFKEQALKFGP